ncbi:hypothetical protein E8E13_009197 [Curvularia kusanoi]|uniref:Amidohydrolase-related domain-containing protein n=1 Tax=Curvularia kusanoi TaxID=90978 RepID=A0A9P4TED4_CURKU|nr:hypothetical protein E8E13_009197 [Curvularia kusanoi]
MAQPPILDSHIHLWPATATTPEDHAWMTDPTHLLSKRHGISDYKRTIQASTFGAELKGFVYVETDRYLPCKTPLVSLDAEKADVEGVLREWARAPLEELGFLRRVVEGKAAGGDGFVGGEGELMKGAVVWAPFHLSSQLFKAYLRIAEGVAGERLWGMVVGFRYLLQGKGEGEVGELVGGSDWVENIAGLGEGREGKGWAFDVGVDIHRDGTEPLRAVGAMIERVREREKKQGSGAAPVRFVLNHLCKHALSASAPTEPRGEWLQAVERLGRDQHVFMKLSGALNEFEGATPESGAQIVESLRPVVEKVFDAFGERVMFGSDWPVCNVGGPAGEVGNWGLWAGCVEELLKQGEVKEVDSESVWWKAACRAYDVQL